MISRIFSCFKRIWHVLPLLTMMEGLSYLGSACVTGFMPIIWKSLYDALYDANDVHSLMPVLYPLLAFITLQLLEVSFRLLGRYVSRVAGYNEKIVKIMQEELLRHAIEVPYECYETSKTYDGYRRSVGAIENQAASMVVQGMYQLPAMILGFVLTLAALWTFHPLLPIIAAMAVLPTLWSTLRLEKASYLLQRGQTISLRKKEYYESLFFNSCAMRDAAVYECSDSFLDSWREYLKAVNREEVQFIRIKTKWFLLSDLSTAIGYGIGIVLSILLGVTGSIGLGSLGAMISSIGALQNSLVTLLKNMGAVQKGTLFFDDYLEFLNLPTNKDEGQFNGIPVIELCDVSYAYPACKKNALSRVNLSVSEGETVALVGANGSGKTTLCKLIMGLYTPSSGDIFYNGVSGKYIDKSRLYQRISPVFQDYVEYHMTIRENVAMSDVSRIADDHAILDALSAADAGFDAESLDMPLGREFGSGDLSGGQWQKLAIARGLFRTSDILFFDEPTSAIDPLTEVSVMKSILQNNTDKTTVLVTHRIGSARLADRIIMMKDGCVLSEGTHDELMSHCVEYRSMFELQAKWYQ